MDTIEFVPTERQLKVLDPNIKVYKDSDDIGWGKTEVLIYFVHEVMRQKPRTHSALLVPSGYQLQDIYSAFYRLFGELTTINKVDKIVRITPDHVVSLILPTTDPLSICCYEFDYLALEHKHLFPEDLITMLHNKLRGLGYIRELG